MNCTHNKIEFREIITHGFTEFASTISNMLKDGYKCLYDGYTESHLRRDCDNVKVTLKQ